jgi:hypothetical protein
MNNQLAPDASNILIPAIGERDREADDVETCSAQLEQLRSERIWASEGHHRAILDAMIQNLRSQLDYAVERRRVKADILRYESERRYEREHKIRAP